MGSIIRVEQESGKEYLQLNKDNESSSSLQQSNSEQSGASFKFFGADVSAKKVFEKSNEWKEEGKSLKQQVELKCSYFHQLKYFFLYHLLSLFTFKVWFI
jgi:hypothetical protein